MDEVLECSLDQQVIGFSRFLREEGLNTGVQETLDALKSIAIVSSPSETNLRTVTRSLFCNTKEDVEKFDHLFDSYWKGDSRRFRSKLSVSHRIQQKESPRSLIWLGGTGEGSGDEHQSKEVSGANAHERLQKTDFSKISEVESEELDAVAQKLWKEMSRRLSQRRKNDYQKGHINIRKTIRRNIGHGGDPYRLMYRRRKPQKPRLVVFLDVSGSMDKYSLYLLRFIYAIQEHFQQVESFLFSTKLNCITDIMRRHRLADQLKELTHRADGWSSGTTMGSCFKEFNDKFAKSSLSRQSIVIILSDGLDTGNSEEMRTELTKISKKAKRLIWLNPLKGMKGYQPEAKGMKSALPLVDIFSSAHNLESLLDLEKHLQHV